MSRTLMSRVSAILNHERTQTAWVCRVRDGKIDRFARICVQYPRDGAGRLTVAVTDFREGASPVHHVASAGGCGYDKVTAALAGAFVGGFELGDDCDHKGRPTLRVLAEREGWQIIGGQIGS